MEELRKSLIDSVQHFVDSILKLSAALLLIPMVFLKFVSEIGPKANPEALIGVYSVSNWVKLGIFLPLSLSIISGLLTKYLVIRHFKIGLNSTDQVSIPTLIHISIILTGVLFVVGLCFLVYLFFLFPIEIPEPFQLGRSQLSSIQNTIQTNTMFMGRVI